jgi:hypothetical protein
MSQDRNPFRPRKNITTAESPTIFSPPEAPDFPASIASQVVGKFDLEELVRSILNQPHEVPQTSNPLAAALHGLVEGVRLNGQIKVATKWAEKLGALSNVVQNATQLERARNDLLRELYLSNMLPQTVKKEYELWIETQQSAIEFQRRNRELENAKFDVETDAAHKSKEFNAERHKTLLEKERLQRELDKAEFEEKIAHANKKKKMHEEL